MEQQSLLGAEIPSVVSLLKRVPGTIGSPRNCSINSSNPSALHGAMMWNTDNKNH